ncbi:uncharacterized protein LOC110841650 [Folsomia candida]|uniref:uncharacterized protein LOC110841650 n=1 Tax=Folsomia candida TaxID=158441 RepID=UPI000B8F1D18|nr:uncharacterized protein LOC110841650 [Folsomia candida]
MEEIFKKLRDPTSGQQIAALQEIGQRAKELSPSHRSELVGILSLILTPTLPSVKDPSVIFSQLLRSLAIVCPTVFSDHVNASLLLTRLPVHLIGQDGEGHISNEDMTNLLTLVDSLTKICASAASFTLSSHLIDKLLIAVTHVLTSRPETSTQFTSALAILTNLSSTGPLAVRTIQKSARFKKTVWPKLVAIFNARIQPNEKNVRNSILLAKFMLTQDLHSSSTLFTYALHHLGALAGIVLGGSNDMMELVSELAVVFDRLVKRLESRAGTDPVTESQKPDDDPESMAASVRTYVELVKLTVEKVKKLTVAKSRTSVTAKPILQLLKALVPEYKTNELTLPDTYEAIFSIIHSLELDPGRGDDVVNQGDIYLAYHHLLSAMATLPNGFFMKKSVLDLLEKVIESVKLQPGISPEIIRQNTTACQLLTLSQKGTMQGNSTIRERVVAKIQEESASCEKLIKDLIEVESTTEVVWCVIEVLSLLANNSRSKVILGLLLTGLNGASRHLAMAIHSTHPTLVMRALSITAAVGFSGDNLKELSESLVKMNQYQVMHASIEQRPDPLSPTATLGLSMIESALEAVTNDSQMSDVTESVSDTVSQLYVVTMYQSKLDVAELRLKRSEERVSQSEEIINRQNKLLNQHGEIVARQLAEMELKEENCHSLRKEILCLKDIVNQQEGLSAETSKAHEEKLRFSQKKMNEQADKISLLEEEVEKIETNRQRLEKLLCKEKDGRRADAIKKKEVEEELKKKEEVLSKQNTKVNRLQTEVQRGQEEQKRLEHLLEKEKQTVEIIRGVLGNNSRIA